jgi:Uncharacterised methyltransferase family (DUF6094)
MALMFQRLARNYAKDGYYPTDAQTLQRVLNALAPTAGDMRIIDPFAGEGVAIAECKHHLGVGHTEAFAVEYHQGRAYEAKKLVDRCIHGDFQETAITPRSFGLLWLNPPYGDLVTDKAQTGVVDDGKGRKRLEKLFYQQSVRLLQVGGILVLIVPHTVLDAEFRRWLASGFDRVQVFMASEQRFKQAVVVGIRKRNDASSETYRVTVKALEQFCQKDDKTVLPEAWEEEPYRVPASVGAEVRFNTLQMDPAQLADEISKYPCLWGQWGMHLDQTRPAQRRPLMALSDWHLALVLAAGQISGVVKSNDGTRTYVVKGDTFKHKKENVQFEEVGDDKTREVRTSLDVFVPVIKALDFSPGSTTFGHVLTIK